MVIAKDTVYILTVPSAMDRQVGVLPTPDAPLVKDLMMRLSGATEAADKSPATRSVFHHMSHVLRARHQKAAANHHTQASVRCLLGAPNACCTLVCIDTPAHSYSYQILTVC